MIKKIIHLSIIPLSDTLQSTLLITEFQKRGIEVEYFDISNIIGFNHSGRNKADYKFERISSLLNYLNDLNRSEVLVNIQLHYEYRFHKFFTEVKKTGVFTSIFCIGFMPTHKPSYLRRLLKDLFLRPSRYYDLVFYDSEKGFQKYKHVSHKIRCRNMITDQFVKSQKISNAAVNSKTAVFIDQFIPFHPDLKFRNVSVLSPDMYFENVNKTLTSIRELGYDIKIAKHPKADERVSLYFPEFEVIANCTSDLISSASLVLAHFSTAVGLAILHEKKILILNCGRMQGVDLEKFISPFEEQLSQPPIYIGSKITQAEIQSITDAKSTPYSKNYLQDQFDTRVFFENLKLATSHL